MAMSYVLRLGWVIFGVWDSSLASALRHKKNALIVGIGSDVLVAIFYENEKAFAAYLGLFDSLSYYSRQFSPTKYSELSKCLTNYNTIISRNSVL
jgi:hypothetical protein